MLKKITIEKLAEVNAKEFGEKGRRFERLEKKVDDLEDKVNTGFQAVLSSLDLMQQDIRDMKITLDPLVRTIAALETDVQHLTTRVQRLEQKVGLVK